MNKQEIIDSIKEKFSALLPINLISSVIVPQTSLLNSKTHYAFDRGEDLYWIWDVSEQIYKIYDPIFGTSDEGQYAALKMAITVPKNTGLDCCKEGCSTQIFMDNSTYPESFQFICIGETQRYCHLICTHTTSFMMSADEIQAHLNSYYEQFIKKTAPYTVLAQSTSGHFYYDQRILNKEAVNTFINDIKQDAKTDLIIGLHNNYTGKSILIG